MLFSVLNQIEQIFIGMGCVIQIFFKTFCQYRENWGQSFCFLFQIEQTQPAGRVPYKVVYLDSCFKNRFVIYFKKIIQTYMQHN